MAVSEAKRAANRRNAQKSTGPRTEQGKERSRLNAVMHGTRAETLVLPGEDPQALEDRERASGRAFSRELERLIKLRRLDRPATDGGNECAEFDEPNSTNEPTAIAENDTNEATAVEENATNEATVIVEIATNEANAVHENVTKEANMIDVIVTNEAKLAARSDFSTRGPGLDFDSRTAVNAPWQGLLTLPPGRP